MALGPLVCVDVHSSLSNQVIQQSSCKINVSVGGVEASEWAVKRQKWQNNCEKPQSSREPPPP